MMDYKNFDRRKFLSQLGLTLGTGIVTSGFKIPFSKNINDECKETPMAIGIQCRAINECSSFANSVTLIFFPDKKQNTPGINYTTHFPQII